MQVRQPAFKYNNIQITLWSFYALFKDSSIEPEPAVCTPTAYRSTLNFCGVRCNIGKFTCCVCESMVNNNLSSLVNSFQLNEIHRFFLFLFLWSFLIFYRISVRSLTKHLMENAWLAVVGKTITFHWTKIHDPDASHVTERFREKWVFLTHRLSLFLTNVDYIFTNMNHILFWTILISSRWSGMWYRNLGF